MRRPAMLCRAYTFHFSGHSIRAHHPRLREMPKLHIKVAASPSTPQALNKAMSMIEVLREQLQRYTTWACKTSFGCQLRHCRSYSRPLVAYLAPPLRAKYLRATKSPTTAIIMV